MSMLYLEDDWAIPVRLFQERNMRAEKGSECEMGYHRQSHREKWEHRLLHHKDLMKKYGKDIFSSPNFKKTRNHIQHGNISVRKHSEQVALTALKIAHTLPIRVKDRDIVRGALLHDYFLYDWHEKKVRPSHLLKFYKMHGFSHPKTALRNASREFELTDREKDIIGKHMWPLTIIPPMCREAWIVTAADKYCSLLETLHLQKYGKKKHGRHFISKIKQAC